MWRLPARHRAWSAMRRRWVNAFFLIHSLPQGTYACSCASNTSALQGG